MNRKTILKNFYNEVKNDKDLQDTLSLRDTRNAQAYRNAVKKHSISGSSFDKELIQQYKEK